MNDYKTNLPIKTWAEDDRPREKLLRKGKRSLTDAELMAILIGSGSRNESAVELSKRILTQAKHNLNELGKLSVNELMKFKGIGEAKAITIVAALELGLRRQATDVLSKDKIAGSQDVYQVLKPILADLPHEEFWVIYLNHANKVITNEQISLGGIAGTVADIKIIFKKALDLLATSVILSHNHPSGNLKPSKADLTLTKKVKDAGDLLEISVLDHVIITDGGYFSFADEGMI